MPPIALGPTLADLTNIVGGFAQLTSILHWLSNKARGS